MSGIIFAWAHGWDAFSSVRRSSESSAKEFSSVAAAGGMQKTMISTPVLGSIPRNIRTDSAMMMNWNNQWGAQKDALPFLFEV